MIEHLANWLEGVGNLGVVDEPTGSRINFSANGDFTLEGVAVKPGAFVIRRNARQAMRRFESKFLNEFYNHSIES